jgi:uncharacterized protein (DUF305 family)
MSKSPRFLSSTSSIVRLFLITLAIMTLSLSPVMAKHSSGKGKGKPAPKPKLTKIDKWEIDFLKKTIDKHAKIIQRIQQVDAVTTDTQVVALAHVFVTREQDEMTSMTAMLNTWFGVTYTPKRCSGSIGDAENAIEAIIGYDHSEIAYANQSLRKGGHVELQALCRQIIDTNYAEIDVLMALLDTYDDPGDSDSD